MIFSFSAESSCEAVLLSCDFVMTWQQHFGLTAFQHALKYMRLPYCLHISQTWFLNLFDVKLIKFCSLLSYFAFSNHILIGWIFFKHVFDCSFNNPTAITAYMFDFASASSVCVNSAQLFLCLHKYPSSTFLFIFEPVVFLIWQQVLSKNIFYEIQNKKRWGK